MKGAAVAALVTVAILVGAGLGFAFGYMTLNGKVADLNQMVSSQEQQVSSLSSSVPDSEIFGVQYAMTLYSHVNGSLDTSAYYTIWDIGLPYHSGRDATLYVDVSQLFSYTGVMNITYIGTRTDGFIVSSISPNLPQVAGSGGALGSNRTILTVVLNTPGQPYHGFLQVYLQAYAVPFHGLPVPP